MIYILCNISMCKMCYRMIKYIRRTFTIKYIRRTFTIKYIRRTFTIRFTYMERRHHILTSGEAGRLLEIEEVNE